MPVLWHSLLHSLHCSIVLQYGISVTSLCKRLLNVGLWECTSERACGVFMLYEHLGGICEAYVDCLFHIPLELLSVRVERSMSNSEVNVSTTEGHHSWLFFTDLHIKIFLGCSFTTCLESQWYSSSFCVLSLHVLLRTVESTRSQQTPTPAGTASIRWEQRWCGCRVSVASHGCGSYIHSSNFSNQLWTSFPRFHPSHCSTRGSYCHGHPPHNDKPSHWSEYCKCVQRHYRLPRTARSWECSLWSTHLDCLCVSSNKCVVTVTSLSEHTNSGSEHFNKPQCFHPQSFPPNKHLFVNKQ